MEQHNIFHLRAAERYLLRMEMAMAVRVDSQWAPVAGLYLFFCTCVAVNDGDGAEVVGAWKAEMAWAMARGGQEEKQDRPNG